MQSYSGRTWRTQIFSYRDFLLIIRLPSNFGAELLTLPDSVYWSGCQDKILWMDIARLHSVRRACRGEQDKPLVKSRLESTGLIESTALSMGEPDPFSSQYRDWSVDKHACCPWGLSILDLKGTKAFFEQWLTSANVKESALDNGMVMKQNEDFFVDPHRHGRLWCISFWDSKESVPSPYRQGQEWTAIDLGTQIASLPDTQGLVSTPVDTD